MDGVHAQEPRLPVGAGPAALADGHRPGPGLGEHGAPAPIGARLAQVVQVPVRQSGQTLEACIGEELELPAKHRASGRAASLLQCRVHLREQAHVRRGVTPREGPRRAIASTVAEMPALAVLAHQAGQLRPRQPRHLRQVRLDRALVRLAQRRVVELHQGAANEVVGRGAIQHLELNRLLARGHPMNLLQGLNPCVCSVTIILR